LLYQPHLHSFPTRRSSDLESLTSVSASPRYNFSWTDICDRESIARQIQLFKPNTIIHLAAESHVDRSIDGPAQFIQTNIVGTYTDRKSTRLNSSHVKISYA